MVIWEWWVICISVALAALAFVALVVYCACALYSIRKLTKHIDRKIHDLDPYFHVLGSVGKGVEKCAYRERERIETRSDQAVDTLEWALMGLTLWQKFKERK